MEKTQIKNSLLEVLKSKKFMSLQIDTTKINDNTSLLNDVGIDSIQLLEFIVVIEKEFKISINTTELSIDIFDRFTDLVDFIHSKINNN